MTDQRTVKWADHHSIWRAIVQFNTETLNDLLAALTKAREIYGTGAVPVMFVDCETVRSVSIKNGGVYLSDLRPDEQNEG